MGARGGWGERKMWKSGRKRGEWECKQSGIPLSLPPSLPPASPCLPPSPLPPSPSLPLPPPPSPSLPLPPPPSPSLPLPPPPPLPPPSPLPPPLPPLNDSCDLLTYTSFHTPCNCKLNFLLHEPWEEAPKHLNYRVGAQ